MPICCSDACSRTSFSAGHSFSIWSARERLTAEWLKQQGSRLSLEQFAEGVIRVVNANMERALRVVSVERGYDPREFALVAFGGAGGLHACDLAQPSAFLGSSFRRCPERFRHMAFWPATSSKIIREP